MGTKSKNASTFDLGSIDLLNKGISSANHCYACTARIGSSKGGYLE